MVCGVFLIKFQYETKFYLLALIFFVIMWIPDGFANDLSINVTKSSYIREINNFKLSYEKISLNILTHDIFIKYGLTEEQIKIFEHKCKFVNNIFEYSKLPVAISPNIPTESNVNFKVINKILKHFHLEELPANDFERRLNKLLTYRNSIAHGECSLPVTKEIIQDFNSTTIDAMHEVTIRIIDGFINKKYLRI